MPRFRKSVFLTCLVILLPILLRAQDSKIDFTQPYLLLATDRTSTTQRELDGAAAQGYRVVLGSRTALGGIGILLEKGKMDQLFHYRLLATSRTSTMQKELNIAAAEGFRILPRTLMGGSSEIIVILERPPGGSTTTEYRLLATRRTGTLQKEMTEAARAGFGIVSVVSRGEHMVILERNGSAKPEGRPSLTRHYVLLATEKTSTMQKELVANASAGYRLLAGSPTSESEIAMFLEQVSETTKPLQYKLLATNKGSTLQDELNAAAAEGFRLLGDHK